MKKDQAPNIAASDRRSFLKRAHALGVPLEVLPEEEEARLISLGIMSGLRFHLRRQR